MILVAAGTAEFDEAPVLRLRMGQLQPAMKPAQPSWAVDWLAARLARIAKALSRQALETLPNALDGERTTQPGIARCLGREASPRSALCRTPDSPRPSIVSVLTGSNT